MPIKRKQPITPARPGAGRPPRPVPPNTFAGRVARNVARLRQRRGWDKESMPERMGVSRATWFRLEAGRHPGATGFLIDRLAKFFKVDVHELTGKVEGER